ncbi:hypothetical protein QTI66_17790 [Variovorax sp. J22R133]|uniref:hypothetical protein n=1 Tax=Variovorax brevis TaxID=3053503 RepID=UPI002576267A|nr:hypothetical protein [Variovorax sp. J22R133]MDM0114010.1 hypothetical protein [Variovorax sp. J22R133]
MHLLELIERHPRRPAQQVPEWMMGLYRRHCIAFADGSSDIETQVFWLQSRNFSIDLRLPRNDGLVALAKPWAAYSKAELEVLGNYEGWVAESVWDGAQLVWREPTALQLHDRWPEPAPLQRVGNCMVEFAPSGAYVEDWRLQPSAPGPLVGLRLLEEKEMGTGRVLHRGGGLIVSGKHAGLVLGRVEPPAGQGSFLEQVLTAAGNEQGLRGLFNFETSIARGSVQDGFITTHSTLPGRVGQPVFALDGFSVDADGIVHQLVKRGGITCERRFEVDVIKAGMAWPQSTAQTDSARDWRHRESATLGRYTHSLI